MKLPRAKQLVKSMLLCCAIAALVPACFFQAVAEPAAYVTSSSASSVYVIDTASEAVAETIPNDGSPSQVVVAPGGLTAYISNMVSDSIAIVDTASNAIIDSIPVGDAPSHLALTPDAATIYVSTSGGVIQCVDIATKTITADIPLFGVGGRLTITPDGRRLYVAWGGVTVIDTTANIILTTFYPGNSAGDVAISPDGTRAYIATTHYEFDPVFSAYGAIQVYDTTDYSRIDGVFTGSLPGAIAVSTDGTRLYAALTATWVNTGYGAGFLPGRVVTAIDLTTLLICGWTDTIKTPNDLALTPDDSKVLVTVPILKNVTVIDTATNTVSTQIPVVGTPGGIGIVPGEPIVSTEPGDLLRVTIDIRPGTAPKNRVSPGNPAAKVTVAVLSTDAFDATTIDSTSVRFGAHGTEAAPLSSRQKDVDGDGELDLLLRFSTGATGIVCGDVSATLKGQTLTGQQIEGVDAVRTVKCP